MILKSKPNSLQSKFLFVVIPSIIIVFAVQFVFWSIISYQAHVGELDENARKLSDSTAKVLSAPLWNLDDERIALVLSSIITDSDVHSAAVFDEKK